eukprot:gene44895-54912_t
MNIVRNAVGLIFVRYTCLPDCQIARIHELWPSTQKQAYSHGRIRFTHLGIQADHKDNIGFFDEAQIFIKGGSGGAGSTSFKFGKNRQHVYPTGGNGGDGGNVYVYVDPNLNTLEKFKNSRSFKAEMGEAGKPYFKNGGRGGDVFVGVPLHTRLSYIKTQDQNETEVSLSTLSEKHH